MFQRVTLIGNLGTDPELRYTPGGTPVCSFSVATNEVRTGPQGQQQKRTTWWRISAWGQLAEVCYQYLSKGRLVYVEGTVTPDPGTGGPRIWTDQNGQPRASFELRSTTVKFLDARGGDLEGGERFDERPARGGSAPARQAGTGPVRQQARPAPTSGPAGGQRRSTTGARPPEPVDVDDEGFGLDEIPF